MDTALERKWLEARERMRLRVDAVFWQDLAVPSPERERYGDWILDRIFMSEYVAAVSDCWTVWGYDESGKNYVAVQGDLSFEEAQSLLKELRMSKPNARYWYGPPNALWVK